MKKNFINQNGVSDKFWNIEYWGKTQKIVFGKTGTKGRETIKEFEDETECTQESEKLIGQKIKKGYTEILENDEVPLKTELSEAEKADIYFWEAIEKSNKYKKAHWSEYDIDEHLENLTTYLSRFGKERLILFEKTLQEKLSELYTAEIAELSIILECDFTFENGNYIFDDYLSDDGFIYFRCWLLLKGREFFEDIKQDIQSFVSGKYSFNIGDCWAEGLLYVSDEAYSENHDNEDESEIRDAVNDLYPDHHYDSMDRQMNREPKGGSDLQKMYPKLVGEIGELRNT
jgi:predicted DNA-binding WGR domain protein